MLGQLMLSRRFRPNRLSVGARAPVKLAATLIGGTGPLWRSCFPRTARVPQLKPHDLRHGAAMEMYGEHGDLKRMLNVETNTALRV
jgi:hypothetical protein